MGKVNLQVRVPFEVDKVISELSMGSKSDFVREAIEEKIRKEKFLKLEHQWVEALKRNPEDDKEAEKWFKAESWD